MAAVVADVVQTVVTGEPKPSDASSSKRHAELSPTSSSASGRAPSGSRSVTSPILPPFSPSSSTIKGKAPQRSSWDPTLLRAQEAMDEEDDRDPYRASFVRQDSRFRGALEYNDIEQREREQEAADRRSRKRDSWLDMDTFRPRKWLGLLQEESELLSSTPDHISEHGVVSPRREQPDADDSRQFGRTGRSLSLPHVKQITTPGWSRLKSMLQRQPSITLPPPAVVAPPEVNIVDELIGGSLSSLMLKMYFERDERGERRVPILLHRLKVRVSDSLHPLSGSKAVFRIECEYANGQTRWVVYRQLRDFLALHTHYRVSNAYNRNIDAMPEFPRTSIPYLNWLKSEVGRDVERAEFARLQREGLENYLVGLIRAVMFHPTANRLCRFLEVSALSIALAPTGGWQYKAGVLKIEPVGKTGVFSRRGLGWREKRKSRWCAVRDSYLVAVQEPGELHVHDVFMLDADFTVERPTRYLRKGLHMLHIADDDEEPHDPANPETHAGSPGTPRSLASHREHPHHQSTKAHPKAASEGGAKLTLRKIFTLGSSRRGRSSSPSSSSGTSSAPTSRAATPLVDPSTGRVEHSPATANNSVLEPERLEENIQQQELDKKKRKSKTQDLSHRTFYVENSQMRLKLTARNEVRPRTRLDAAADAPSSDKWISGSRHLNVSPRRAIGRRRIASIALRPSD